MNKAVFSERTKVRAVLPTKLTDWLLPCMNTLVPQEVAYFIESPPTRLTRVLPSFSVHTPVYPEVTLTS